MPTAELILAGTREIKEDRWLIRRSDLRAEWSRPPCRGCRDEGGASVSEPTAREAAQAVVTYANANLGGIDGHPIDLIICKEQEDPASAATCANQMVADNVAAVVVTETAMGDVMAPIIQKAKVTGIVLAEQHVYLALETADRATFLAHGDVVYTGSARDLAAHPERVEAAYLGVQGKVRP
jgi:Periplasmic binding protein